MTHPESRGQRPLCPWLGVNEPALTRSTEGLLSLCFPIGDSLTSPSPFAFISWTTCCILYLSSQIGPLLSKDGDVVHAARPQTSKLLSEMTVLARKLTLLTKAIESSQEDSFAFLISPCCCPRCPIPLITTAFHTGAARKGLGLWSNTIDHRESKAMKGRWKNPMFFHELTFPVSKTSGNSRVR